MNEDGIEEARSRARQLAKEKGYILNVDERQLEAVLRGLARNQERYGAGYCPCRIRSGDPKKDQTIICPCVHHEKEIEEEGACHCRLFFKGPSE